MITKIEADREGEPLRVFHRAGQTSQGRDSKYAWTHPLAERTECSACTHETIPEPIKKGER
jgi:hypothetical protein